jgi:hypothetical protein
VVQPTCDYDPGLKGRFPVPQGEALGEQQTKIDFEALRANFKASVALPSRNGSSCQQLQFVTALQFGIRNNLRHCHHGAIPLYVTIELLSWNDPITVCSELGGPTFQRD